MNQEHTNFLVASVEALKSEVARKDTGTFTKESAYWYL